MILKNPWSTLTLLFLAAVSLSLFKRHSCFWCFKRITVETSLFNHDFLFITFFALRGFTFNYTISYLFIIYNLKILIISIATFTLFKTWNGIKKWCNLFNNSVIFIFDRILFVAFLSGHSLFHSFFKFSLVRVS